MVMPVSLLEPCGFMMPTVPLNDRPRVASCAIASGAASAPASPSAITNVFILYFLFALLMSLMPLRNSCSGI